MTRDLTPPLPAAFLRRPIAHRAYHDTEAGRPENSRAAVRAAVEAGYAIEIDVQLSSDGRAMVFHDDDLDRLTDQSGPLRDRSADELAAIPLRHGDEGIPTLPEILRIVAGQVPLVIEIKDQDGALGPDIGALERAVAEDIRGYDGPLAVMSFNPHSMIEMRRLAGDVPRGLVTAAYDAEHWPQLPEETRARLRKIPDITRSGASFISHQANDLERVAILAKSGLAVICWTIRTPEQEAMARKLAANVTFEGYPAEIPA